MAATVAVAAIAVGGGLLVNPSPAAAHGATMFPASRQFACWEEALTDRGTIEPQTEGCVAWVNDAGTTPYYNWFADLNSNANGGTVGVIPDGTICSGGDQGPFDFSALNDNTVEWPTTNVNAGGTVEFRHNNWADHPGRFDVYVTVQGWNPNAPLSWSDLELVDTAQDPPATGGPGSLNYYFWDTTLPSNRSGQHIIFTHWVRSDSPENFYSCSDVIFG